MDKRQQEKEKRVQEEKEFAQFWKVRNDELSLAEEQERQEQFNRQAELKKFQRIQSAKIQERAKREFEQEQQAALKAQALLDQQEKNFYSYAEKAIKQWEANGKNVKPLILELKGYKKKLV